MSARVLADEFEIQRIQAIDLIKNMNTVITLYKSNGNNEKKTIKRRKTE